MSHTAIILLALAFLIGWMGGRERASSSHCTSGGRPTRPS